MTLVLFAEPAAAQRRFAPLGKHHLPEANDETYGLALGDVDSDGDMDVFAGNRGRCGLALNDGHGVFVDAMANVPPYERMYGAAFGDVDGDGDLDLVSTALFLNDGRGVFAVAPPTWLPVRSSSARVLADLDGDGDLDLWLGQVGQQNQLLLNDGTGRFVDTTSTRLPVDSDPTVAVVGIDIEDDGDLDLVVGNFRARDRVYRNDGRGFFTYAPESHLPVDSDLEGLIAPGDVDGDGDSDLVVGRRDSPNSLFLNNGRGQFRRAGADRLPPGADATSAIAVGDVDADGDLDVLFGNDGTTDQLVLNDGQGRFSPAATHVPQNVDHTRSVHLADADGDGDLDAFIGNASPRYGPSSAQNRLWLNDGTGRFVDANRPRAPIDVRAIASAVGDVDGDGDIDVARANPRGQNRLLINDGKGSFVDESTARLPAAVDRTGAVAFGDVDGDGDIDLVFGNAEGEQSRLYRNDGSGRFAEHAGSTLPQDDAYASDLAIVDVDGDGDRDIVVANGWQQNRLYLNGGVGDFVDGTSQLPADRDNSSSVTAADIDGDGDVDLLFGNGSNSLLTVRLYVNDGQGGFADDSAARLPAVDGYTTSDIAAGDIDGDGDLDLVLAKTNGQISGGCPGDDNQLWLNDGTGRFDDATHRLPEQWGDDSRAVALVDVEGDGDLDLLFANVACEGPGYDYLLVNDGQGRFTRANSPSPGSATDIALGDLDGDGDLDAVWGGPGRIEFNLRRQIDSPLLARTGTRHSYDIYARPSSGGLFQVAMPVVATGESVTPLPLFGTFGLDPAQMVALDPILVPQPAGKATFWFEIPNDPGLRGTRVFAQALVLDPTTPARLTSVVEDVVR